MTISAEVRGSFPETEARKTAENAVKHRDGGESLMAITTLLTNHTLLETDSILGSKYI